MASLKLPHVLLPYVVLLIAMICNVPVHAHARAEHIIRGSNYINFPTTHRGKYLEGGGYLVMPPTFTQGQPPVPVIVILHGSRGIMDEREPVYAHELASMGVAAFIVDSFSPRGITDTTENQRQLTNRDFVNDAFAALKMLSADPRIDAVRSGIIGYSKSGQVAMQTALRYIRSQSNISKQHRFKAHYLFYPACNFHFYEQKTTGAPITFFLGERDEYTGVTQCVDLANELKVHGADVTTIIYPDGYHGWDVPGFEFMPGAEVHLNCRFYEQADGTWEERFSGIKNIPDLTSAQYEKARRACVSRGATVSGNNAIRFQGIETLKQLVQKQVVEWKMPEQPSVNPPVMENNESGNLVL